VKRILVTRPRAQAAALGEGLRAVGFEPVYFPVIEICPIEDIPALNKAFDQLHCYAWVVFTSVNAVDVVFDKFPGFSGAGVKFAAIGPKTAEALKARGITPDFIPQEYVAEAILPGLGDLKGKWILLPRAEIARKELPEAIVLAGGTAHEISVYKTLPTQPDREGLAALESGVDVITFTSASSVENFVAIMRQHRLDPLNLPNNPLFACIGPITERAAREEGLLNLVVAKEYTTDGLIEAIRSLETL
jgi:uroporphyrinogen III methyltransferase/synthase